MGVHGDDIGISYASGVLKSLTIRGQYMYTRADARGLIKMAEAGVLKLGQSRGQKLVGEFKLEELDKAFETAAANAQAGRLVVFTP